MVYEDKQRMEFVEFWAKECKKDMKKCLAQTTLLVNSQINSANEFYSKLAKTPQGRAKIRKLKHLE